MIERPYGLGQTHGIEGCFLIHARSDERRACFLHKKWTRLFYFDFEILNPIGRFDLMVGSNNSLISSTLLSYFKALKGWLHITQGTALRYEVGRSNQALKGRNHISPFQGYPSIHALTRQGFTLSC